MLNTQWAEAFQTNVQKSTTIVSFCIYIANDYTLYTASHLTSKEITI